MGYPLTMEEKCYCTGGEELLRTVLITPEGLGGEETAELSRLLGEIKARSLFFSEQVLLPAFKAEYDALSPRDKKFSVPRRVYRVTVTVERETSEIYGACLRTTLLVALRKRGRNEFETRVERLWAKNAKDGVYKMVTESSIDEKLRKST